MNKMVYKKCKLCNVKKNFEMIMHWECTKCSSVLCFECGSSIIKDETYFCSDCYDNRCPYLLQPISSSYLFNMACCFSFPLKKLLMSKKINRNENVNLEFDDVFGKRFGFTSVVIIASKEEICVYFGFGKRIHSIIKYNPIDVFSADDEAMDLLAKEFNSNANIFFSSLLEVVNKIVF